MARWYAGAVVSQMCDDGIRRWLVINTRSTNPKYADRPVQTKFFGGTEENHEDEDKTILDTLRREFTEESDLIIRAKARMTMLGQPVNLPGHFKIFYDIDFTDCEGTLRTVEKTIEGDWMSKPYWVTFKEGCKALYGDHNSALQKSAERHKCSKAA
jgi:hypothetical protein